METFAIIGAGFSGALTAIHLLRAPGPSPRRIVLIERSGRFGRGIAYGSTCTSHVLNVPTGRMSAFEDQPDHFLRWARARDASIEGGSFLPRMLYGEYLESLLESEQAAAAPGVLLERRAEEAIDISDSGGRCTIHFAGGGKTIASRAVLAIGNFPPSNPPLSDPAAFADPRYLRDPWEIARYDRLDPARPVLLIGTGLTMIDVVLELAARGQEGPILAISRRGQLPQPHRSPAIPHHHDAPADIARWEPTAKGILRALRREVRRAAAAGIDWREVVTSIRHETGRLWQSMPIIERQRFLIHLRAYWDSHRHRAAPQSCSAVDGLMRTGRLKVVAARLQSLRSTGDGLECLIQPRSGDAAFTFQSGAVINCTGPDTNLARVEDPLLRSLRDRHLIRTDALGLGLDADEDGAVIDRAGRVSPWLYAIGPLRRPQLWETTAVPELRIQAAQLAGTVAGHPAALAHA